MKKLTYEKFLKARDYIFAHSGDIDRAWFRYDFEDGDTDAFMQALAKYQYDNGGFGGIYYEFDYQGPCLKSTEVAVWYILKLKIRPSADHPVIQKMMKYILENYHPEIGNWGEPAVPEVNEGVYNYWTGYSGEVIVPLASEDERIEKYNANERVCFAAFVALYPELVPDELYRDIIKYPTEFILRYYDENSPDYRKDIFDEGEPYDFEYFQWFVPCLKDRDTADKLTSILRQNPTAFMELDFSKANHEYVHLPCDAIDSPDNIIYPAVKDLVDASLDFRIDQQSDDGRWPLGWSFGDSEGFRKLHTLYETHRTMKILTELGRFGRIEM